ncbi:diaminopimelate decarboxylase [Actinoalloteichus spitiensis]|uniref:diaminopimelate decarboxylase n=1 Tax=Actinoalloteichus spitiensis TaxID=252394 RepID=UPI00047471FA|nr:diaminopimelate decarboxylase [Actinoalloteichus spitiensis]
MRAHPAGPRHAEVLLPVNTAGPRPASSAELDALPPSVWPANTSRHADGAVRIGGVDVRELAREFGTPLFVLDEDDFRSRCREYQRAFGDRARVHYASKAFLCTEAARWVAQEGLSLDVCSGGELAVALRADFPPERIAFHGNNKSVPELAAALEAGVGVIVVDSFEEIDRLDRLTAENPPADGRQDVMIRVTVGVEAHTHEFIATAHEDQKFGFSLAGGAAAEAARRVLRARGLRLVGLHSHIGSQIFDLAGFELAAKRIVGLLSDLHDEHGAQAMADLDTLDLGGGLGIAYTEQDRVPEVGEIAGTLWEIVRRECGYAGLDTPLLAVEPGRSIVGPVMVTLYEVGTTKDVVVQDGASRRYVSVDGGMSDNIRTALYDAVYDCRLVSRRAEEPPVLSRVVGKHCESGDIVVRDCWLPADLRPGDLVAVAATGAYCYAMASDYNRLPRPAVVAVRDGAARLLLRRETMDDLLRLEVS